MPGLRRSRRAAALGVLLVVAGGWITWRGAEDGAAPPAPLPSVSFSVAAPPVPASRQDPSVSVPVVIDDAADQPVDDRADDHTGIPVGIPASVSPAAMAPNRVLIPSLGVYARMVPEGLDGGELSIPANRSKVAVYSDGAAVFGDSGTVLLAGHVTYNGVRGSFWPLSSIKAGDPVYLTDDTGRRSAWAVTSLTTAAPGDVASLPIWSATGRRALVLVTCGGAAVPLPGGHWGFARRVIVEAVPA